MSHPEPYSIKRHGTTLETCDQEPVQTPGCIQEHGVLLVVRSADLVMVQVSENTARWLDREPDELLGSTLSTLFSVEQIELLRAELSREAVDKSPVYLFTWLVARGETSRPLHVSFHLQDSLVMLELEEELEAAEPDYYSLVRRSLARFQAAATLRILAQTVTEEVRAETGFDRAMVYYFHADDSGEVLAEAKREDLNSWKGWRYPSHDIPKPARDIFQKIWCRPVPNVKGKLAEMVPLLNPETKRPLDMTYCALRGASLMYTEYLENMGVGAALTLPLMLEGKLWGLIACHHYSPRPISYRVRAAGEFLAKAASQQLGLANEREQGAYRSKLESTNHAVISRMVLESDFSALTRGPDHLLSAMDAGGAAVCYRGTWHTVGKCPETEELNALSTWLLQRPETNPRETVLATDHLSSLYPPAKKYAILGSGLLALRFSEGPPGFVMWFRPETLQTFTWAGNPNELSLVSGPHGPRLTPRKSFEIWRETVENRSLPWKKVEVESAENLRGLIIDLILSRGEQLEQLNAALRLSRARFDVSLDAAQLGAWEFNDADQEVWRTPRHDLIYGYDQLRPEWRFSRTLRHIHADDRKAVQNQIETAFAQRCPFEVEARIVDAKGQPKWIWLYGTPIDSAGNNIFVGLVGDITARKSADQLAKTQSSLRVLRSAMSLALATGVEESETFGIWAQLLAAHLDSGCVLVWLTNAAGDLQFRASAGVPAEVPVEELPAAEILKQSSATGQTNSPPALLAAAGFSSLVALPMTLDNRNFGLVAIALRAPLSLQMVEEVRTMVEGAAQWSKRHAVEKAFAESNDRVRLAVEAGNLGAWDYYPESGVLQWSARCKALFGLPPEAKVDFPTYLAALHPDDRERATLAVERALNPEGDGRIDLEYRAIGLEDKVHRWIRSTGQAYFNEDRTVNRLIGTVQDITEMVIARELLATRGRELQELVDLRTTELTATIGELEAFSYSISHDMRSPLRAMQGFSQALLEEYSDKLDHQGLDYLHRIERGAKRLDLLIQDVLSYSRVSKSEGAMKPLLLQPLLEEIIQSHPEFNEPNSSILLNLVPVQVMGHEAFLSQVFSNLLGNAVKFQRKDTKPVITVASELSNGFVRISVSDNGIGIDQAHHDRIFQIFGRVHPERQYEGTGIGLAIVKKAIERMGGQIELESTPDRGTRFWFTLRKAS